MMRNPTQKLISLIVAASLYSPVLWAQMDQPEADHPGMQMPASSAVTASRDPHANADGYTLITGPYAQPQPRQLKLADEHAFWAVLGDRLEYQANSDSAVFDLQGWYGTTFDRLVVKAEGDITKGQLEQSETSLLWGHAVTAYFDSQIGMRLDQTVDGPNRQWLAMGLQGLAPYWFELNATAYLGAGGRTALAVEAEYEVLLSQKLILQPRAQLTLYGKDDPANGLGSGITDAAFGLRLRYEFSRQLAPYVGVEWSSAYGATADYLEAEGQPRSDTKVVAGVKFWF